MPAFTDQEHDQVHARAFEVEHRVEEQYDLTDGGDLYYNLVQAGVISITATVDEAARIVAQHLQQA